MSVTKPYRSFKDFYPHYLMEHASVTNRQLHFAGTLLLLCLLVAGTVSGTWWFFALVPVTGYGFAWIGHFFIEKNRPATFTYPLYSLSADFVMFWDILTGRLPQKMASAKKQFNG
jgi:hypothetical protein